VFTGFESFRTEALIARGDALMNQVEGMRKAAISAAPF